MVKLNEYDTDKSFYSVNHNLNECILSCVNAAYKCENEQAKRHLIYGAGRRLRILQRSFHTIAHLATSDRNKPLDDEEQVELNLHLNSLYLHLKGLMDNLAWAVVYEFSIFEGFDEKRSKDKHRVDLFKKDFMRSIKAKFPDFYQALQTKKDWNHDLKNRRDPVAHRIPIYAIPSFLDKEEAARYEKKYTEAISYLNDLDFKESDGLLEEIQQMGTYLPMFHHTEGLEQKLYPVSPQVVCDLDNMTEIIFSALRLFIKERED